MELVCALVHCHAATLSGPTVKGTCNAASSWVFFQAVW